MSASDGDPMYISLGELDSELLITTKPGKVLRRCLEGTECNPQTRNSVMMQYGGSNLRGIGVLDETYIVADSGDHKIYECPLTSVGISKYSCEIFADKPQGTFWNPYNVLVDPIKRLVYNKYSPAHKSLTASVVIPYAGDWSVSVTQGTYNVQHFLGSPRLITVAAAATDPPSCKTSVSSNLEVGDFLTASISTFDEHSNPTADPSDALTYWLNDDSAPALLDGNTVSAQVDVPGLQLLHVAVNGVEIGGSPYSFSVTGDLACPSGFTPVDNRCERCANGFVKLDATSAPCSACLSFVAGSVDTDPVRTPDSADSCICSTGFVLFESECVECPEGTECAAPGINVLTLPLEAGYWRASNESMEVMQCGEVDACTPAECEDRNEEIEEQTGGAAEDCSYYEEYSQILGSLSVTMLVDFGPAFSGLTQLLAASNLDFVSFLPLGCVASMDHHGRLLGYTVGILILDAVLLLAYKAAGKGKGGQVLMALFLVNSFLLPQVSMVIFSTFPCTQFDGDYGTYLTADKSIDCDGAAHAGMVAYATAMIFVFPVGKPLLCLYLLWR
ncbi:hypothetical protein TeGR_g11912, partial [Tetraparma gracilis]